MRKPSGSPTHSGRNHDGTWQLGYPINVQLTFTDITVGSDLVLVAVVLGGGYFVGHGLFGAVIRVVEVKHVADITE